MRSVWHVIIDKDALIRNTRTIKNVWYPKVVEMYVEKVNTGSEPQSGRAHFCVGAMKYAL